MIAAILIFSYFRQSSVEFVLSYVSVCSEQCGKAVLVSHVPDGGPGAGAVGHREHQHRSRHHHDQNAVASDEAAEARRHCQRVLELRAPTPPSHDSLRRLQGIPISISCDRSLLHLLAIF